MSPAFPTGGFAYSHGLEQAIEAGQVRQADALRDWISALLENGSAWNDAVLFAAAYRAAQADVAAVAELARAMAASSERELETHDLGRAFCLAVQPWFPELDGHLPYPIAAARACRAAAVPCEAGLLALLQGFSNALISVAVRLVPLGQRAGLDVMRMMMPVVAAVAARAAGGTLDDLGSATVISDIAAMQHETLYSRVFRT